jgi:hypothetical protein
MIHRVPLPRSYAEDAMFTAGDKVHLSPKYWAEPEPGRFAIIEDPAFTKDIHGVPDLALVHPLKADGTKEHYRCTYPLSLMTKVG